MSCGETKSGDNKASAMKKSMTPRPTMPWRFRRYSTQLRTTASLRLSQTSRRGETVGAVVTAVSLLPSLSLDPRVEESIGNVGEEIGNDDRNAADQEHALKDRIVVVLDGRIGQQTDSGVGENCLDNDGATDHEPEAQHDQRE